MTDNDPAATAALADMVAELDRQFPRREEATGRAMCAGWSRPVWRVRPPSEDVSARVARIVEDLERSRSDRNGKPPTVRDDVASVTS